MYQRTNETQPQRSLPSKFYATRLQSLIICLKAVLNSITYYLNYFICTCKTCILYYNSPCLFNFSLFFLYVYIYIYIHIYRYLVRASSAIRAHVHPYKYTYMNLCMCMHMHAYAWIFTRWPDICVWIYVVIRRYARNRNTYAPLLRMYMDSS